MNPTTPERTISRNVGIASRAANRVPRRGVSSGLLHILGTLWLSLGAILSPALAQPSTYTFTIFAGSNTGPGSVDGTGSVARFLQPWAVALDGSGNLYVADAGNHTIRRVTPAGVVTTFAGQSGSFGSQDGAGGTARFYFPSGVAIDDTGNVYVADTSNHLIRKITSAGLVSTLAGTAGSSGSIDGPGSTAKFNYPRGVAVDSVGNVYVSDSSNHTIRKITPSGVVTTLAGTAGSSGTIDGTGSAARFNYPRGVTADSNGNIYVADRNNHTIRKVTPSGIVTTVAGAAGSSGSTDGTGNGALFNYPSGVAIDSSGTVYVGDTSGQTIRKITSAGVVTTLAGKAGIVGSTDGTGTTARFTAPVGVAVDANGNVYVGDNGNSTIRKITLGVEVTTLAGAASEKGSIDGTGTVARFNEPRGVATDSSGNVYVVESVNSTLRRITPGGVVSTLAGAGWPGSADGTGRAAQFYSPCGVATDSNGNMYVADWGNHTIRRITSAGVVTTLAGTAGSAGAADGTGSVARFNGPEGIVVDRDGNLFVADTGNHTIRKITSGGVVTTFAGAAGVSGGADGTGSAARFNTPRGVEVDSGGNVYVADLSNNTIRKITPGGVVTTVAGMLGSSGSSDGIGSAARFYYPSDIAIDVNGNVYVADAGNDTIRKIAPDRTVTTIAASPGVTGNMAGTGTFARFNDPVSIAVDGSGNLYVADSSNRAIRKGSPALADTATIDSSTGVTGVVRQLGSSPQQATSWSWRQLRQPTSSNVALSATGIVNPTFIPDRDDLYEFELTATASTGISITRVTLLASSEPVLPPSFFTALAASSSNVSLYWYGASGATSYQLWRSSHSGPYVLIGTTVSTAFDDNGLAADTTYLYKVRSVGRSGLSEFSSMDYATTTPFTDPTLTSGTTIRALHIIELRTAVNAMRAAGGLAPAAFSDASLQPGHLIRAVHVMELRAALNEALERLGLYPVGWGAPIIAGQTVVETGHFEPIRRWTQ